MIQVAGAHPLTLRAVRRATALAARSRSTSGPELAAAKKEFKRLIAEHGLYRDRLCIPAHPRGLDASGEVLVVTGSLVPWWRTYLALAVAQHFGFRHFGGPRSWPWTRGNGVFALELFGEWAAIEAIHTTYAVADVAVAGLARRAPRDRVDEYLAGAAMGLAAGLGALKPVSNRKAMVVYVPPAETSTAAAPTALDRYLDTAVANPWHPLTRGFLAAQRLRLASEVVGWAQ